MSTQNETRKRGKPRPGFTRNPWRDNVHPIFAAWSSSQKKNRALAKVHDREEFKGKFEEWLTQAAPVSRAMNEARSTVKNSVGAKLLGEISRGLKFHDFSDPEGGNNGQGSGMPVNPESSPLFWQLVFLKYGITFRELIRQLEIEKRPAAHRKLMAVHRDYWKMMTKGPVNLKLKYNWDHFSLMIQGLDFGLDRLAPEELSECLDEICPCGQRHSPEYLKKVRTSVKKACDRYSIGK